jgi:hypothetical protein
MPYIKGYVISAAKRGSLQDETSRNSFATVKFFAQALKKKSLRNKHNVCRVLSYNN